MGVILRIASSRIVGKGDIVGRSESCSLNLSDNSVMRGRVHARRTLKGLVADLRLKTLNVDPIWLESYVNKFVLRSDFIALCNDNNCGKDVSQQLMTICKEKGFIESVDKDIVLWFHNNSFRGLYKEKVILIELTDRILNVKPTQLQKVQGLLIDETGNDDVLLKLDLNKMRLKFCLRKTFRINMVMFF